jgi:HEAT repeat protein
MSLLLACLVSKVETLPMRVMEPLFNVVRAKSDAQYHEHVSSVLAQASSLPKFAPTLKSSFNIMVCCELLSNKNREVRRNALRMLANFHPIYYEKDSIFNISFDRLISFCLQMLQEEDNASMSNDILTVLMQLSFERKINATFLKTPESVAMLRDFLRDENVEIRRNVATIWCNLSYRMNSRAKFTQLNVLPSLISLIEDPDVKVRRSVLAAICNLTHGKSICQELLRQSDTVGSLTSLLADEDDEVQLYATVILKIAAGSGYMELSSANVVSATPYFGDIAQTLAAVTLNKSLLFEKPTIAMLVPMIVLVSDENEIVRIRAITALKHLSSDSANHYWMRIAGVVACLLNLLAHESNSEVIQNTLQIFSALEVDEDEIEDAGGIAPILNLLSNVDLNIRQDASKLLHAMGYM